MELKYPKLVVVGVVIILSGIAACMLLLKPNLPVPNRVPICGDEVCSVTEAKSCPEDCITQNYTNKDCKLYQEPCCGGYICALDEPICGDSTLQCKMITPPSLTRVYCEFYPINGMYPNDCTNMYIDPGSCEEYCDYWKSQDCKTMFTEEELSAGYDPFDLGHWQENCADYSCECFDSR